MFLLKRLVGFYQKKGGDIEKMNEKIIEFPNLKSEKMITESEKINETIEKIPEKRRRGQRGADKKPRRFNKNSLQNLKPFRTKLSNSRTPTTNLSNSSSGNNNWILGFGIGVIAAPIIIAGWMLYKRMKKEESVLEKKVLEHTS